MRRNSTLAIALDGYQPFYPRELAERARREYPRLWAKHGTGGHPPTRWTGDDAYQTWGWLEQLRRGEPILATDMPAVRDAYFRLTGRTVIPSPALVEELVEAWLGRREAYLTRHARDYRPGGITAAIKWGLILPWAWSGEASHDAGARQAAAQRMFDGLTR